MCSRDVRIYVSVTLRNVVHSSFSVHKDGLRFSTLEIRCAGHSGLAEIEQPHVKFNNGCS